MALTVSLPLAAQEQMFFGDLQVFGRDSVISRNPTLASLTGKDPVAQLLVAQGQLNIHERLIFEGGQLYLADALTWWQGADGGTLQNDLIQAYVSLAAAPGLTLVFGKQRLPWGTGYEFSPGDKLDPPVNPQNKSEGFFGFTATFAPSASFSLTAAVRFDTAFPVNSQLPGLASSTSTDLAADLPFLAPSLPSLPSSPWRGLRYALYADAFLGSLDVHAAVTWQWQRVLRPTAGFSLDVFGFILDSTLAVEFSNSALYPDQSGSYANPGFGRAFPIATVGLQRTVSTDSASFAATVEYLYDSTGYDGNQAARFMDDFFAALAAGLAGSPAAVLDSAASGAWLSSGEVIPPLGRHYAALSFTAAVNGYFSADVAMVMNLQDRSFALQPELRWTRLPGIDLFVRAIAAWGEGSHSEFGILPAPVTADAGVAVHF